MNKLTKILAKDNKEEISKEFLLNANKSILTDYVRNNTGSYLKNLAKLDSKEIITKLKMNENFAEHFMCINSVYSDHEANQKFISIRDDYYNQTSSLRALNGKFDTLTITMHTDQETTDQIGIVGNQEEEDIE